MASLAPPTGATTLVVMALLIIGSATASFSTYVDDKTGGYNDDTPIVTTPYGKVQGFRDQGVFAFKGVPFAAPPVGNLRFAPTEETHAYEGILNATTFSPGCMAQCKPTAFPKPEIMCTPTTSEDCLYLNIYTPNASAAAHLPVIMFIHGGNYIGGSGGVPIYDGSSLARRQNVVVVTINYRLGILGGLFTGTVRGNFQTMDQRQAMKWVQKSIMNFGGNPELVTITGQSAGAFSVATHLSSPQSWPFFHHAVIISDPFSLKALDPELAMELGTKALKKLNCPSGGALELACLRNKTAEELLTLQEDPLTFTPFPGQILVMMMPWVPVVDGDELPYQPLHALTNGEFNRVPVMFGTVANESVQFVYDISQKPMKADGYYELMGAIFGLKDLEKINVQYGDVPPAAKDDVRLWMSPLVTDFIFYAVNKFIGAGLTKHTDTYMYLFDKLGTWGEWVFGKNMPWCVTNVCHASDLPFIFDPFNVTLPASVGKIPQPTAEENQLINFMQTMYGNFARTGNPNDVDKKQHQHKAERTSSGLPGGIVWGKFNNSVNNLLNLSTPVSHLNGYRNGYCDFWDKIGFNRY